MSIIDLTGMDPWIALVSPVPVPAVPDLTAVRSRRPIVVTRLDYMEEGGSPRRELLVDEGTDVRSLMRGEYDWARRFNCWTDGRGSVPFYRRRDSSVRASSLSATGEELGDGFFMGADTPVNHPVRKG
ncbi:hypothetical protein B484DRAFT_411340 [Ochromonadaceae sp. CCMP2298]|nr:hypothetical protein B484DRAFT_411340 [Ochromonadaceae sp. CCMP2298]